MCGSYYYIQIEKTKFHGYGPEISPWTMESFFSLSSCFFHLTKSLNPIEEDQMRSANFPCNRSLTTHICSFSFLKKKKTFVFSTFFKAMIPGNGIYVASLRQNNQLFIFDEFLSCPIKKKKVREYVHIKGTEIVCVYIYIYINFFLSFF